MEYINYYTIQSGHFSLDMKASAKVLSCGSSFDGNAALFYLSDSFDNSPHVKRNFLTCMSGSQIPDKAVFVLPNQFLLLS